MQQKKVQDEESIRSSTTKSTSPTRLKQKYIAEKGKKASVGPGPKNRKVTKENPDSNSKREKV